MAISPQDATREAPVVRRTQHTVVHPPPMPSIVRVATVGDSLTAAASRCNVNEPWPTLLGKRGEYAVRNFAFAGASEETTAEAYQRSDQLSSMAAFNPEIVTVMLGTFDADRANWRQEDYMISMRTLIHQFQTLPTSPTTERLAALNQRPTKKGPANCFPMADPLTISERLHDNTKWKSAETTQC